MADKSHIWIALGGNTVLRASGRSVEVLKGAPLALHAADRFEVEQDVCWLDVAPDGASGLIWGGWASRLWLWRDGHELALIAAAESAADFFGGSFISLRNEILLAVSQHGVLRAVALDGHERFTWNLRTPVGFHVRGVAQPSDRWTLLFGNEGREVHNSFVTVPTSEMLCNANAVVEAIRSTELPRDRAIRIAVGPCGPTALVAFRDPEDEEEPQDPEDFDELGDVENFKGLYIRDIGSRALIGRISYDARVRNGVRIAATDRLIALEVVGGIDVVSRRTGGVLRRIRSCAAALDVAGQRAVWMHKDGRIEVASLAQLS